MKLRICRLSAIAICVFSYFADRTLAQSAASLALRSGAAADQEEVLWNFCSKGGSRCTDGAGPRAGLIMDGSRHLYGTTAYGGHGAPDAGGTVFELTPNAARTKWTETVLYRFCVKKVNCIDGKGPGGGLIMDGSGRLYGPAGGGAHGEGVVFELEP